MYIRLSTGRDRGAVQEFPFAQAQEMLARGQAETTAIPFNYYFQALGGPGNDVLGAIQNATAAGITLAAGDWPANGLIVIEIDADELHASTVGGVLANSLGVYSYVAITVGSPAAVDMACVIVVLSGGRYEDVSSPTVTT